LKNYNLPGTDQILAEGTKAGGEILKLVDPLLGNNRKQTRLHNNKSTCNSGGTTGMVFSMVVCPKKLYAG
jgi:hypothetical protein